MGNPTENAVEFINEAKKFIGRGGNVFIGDEDPPIIPSFTPQHKVKCNGKKAKAAESSSNFKNGATPVAQVSTIDVTNNSLSDGVDTLTVTIDDGSPTVFTFVSGSPSGNQIQIGGNAGATETAIATAINALAGVASSVVSSKAQVTSDTAGVPFTLATNAPSKLTLATPTPNVVGKATATVEIIKNSGQNPKEGTPTEVAMGVEVNGKDRQLKFGYYTQVGDTPADIAQGIIDVYSAGITDPDSVANGYIRGLGDNDEPEDLQAALINLFGEDPEEAFTLTDAKITFTLANAGADGNKVWLKTRVRNSPPSPEVGVTSRKAPDLPGFEHLCQFDKFNVTSNANIVKYKVGNVTEELSVPGTRSTSGGFGVYANLDLSILAKVSGANAETFSEGSQYLLFGGAPLNEVLDGKRIIFVFDDDDGESGIVDLYKCILSNLVLDLDNGAVNAVPCTLSPQPFLDRPGDKFGYIRLADAA